MDVLNGYRDNHDTSSDDDSEDSDKECTVWKRATVKKPYEDELLPKVEATEPKVEAAEPKVSPIQAAKRQRKINNIWSEVLQDQLISEDLEDCLLKNKPRDYGNRGKESYDYTLKYTDYKSDKDSDSHMSDSALDPEPSKLNSKNHSSRHHNVRKFIKLDSAELTAARKINKVLNEKKVYLIQRIVKTIGIEKAMSLLSMTQEIEDSGGMMINSQKRRRTPGGVYIQLLKNDKTITQDMLDKIFEGEMSGKELKKYFAEKKKSKKKNKSHRQRSNESKLIPNSNTEVKESNEIVPMDAENTGDMNSETTNLDDDNVGLKLLFSKDTIQHSSDLEEGEIEE